MSKPQKLESHSTLQSKKSICLFRPRFQYFYAFNVTTGNSRSKFQSLGFRPPLAAQHYCYPHQQASPLPPLLKPADGDLTLCSLAAVGTHLYSIGGMRKRDSSRLVYRADLSGTEPLQWEQLAPMILPRTDHLTFVVRGKIYVFGGGSFSTPFGEVYDPAHNQWTPLSDPPDGVSTVQAFGVATDHTVLYASDGELLSYDVLSDHWEEISTHHRPFLARYDHGRDCGELVCADNVLYWLDFSTGLLRAYDLDTRYRFKSRHPVDCIRNYSLLSHLGGNRFCLVSRDLHPVLDGYDLVHCLNFRVKKDEDSLRMDTKFESCHSYTTDKNEAFSCSLTIDGQVLQPINPGTIISDTVEAHESGKLVKLLGDNVKGKDEDL